MAKVTREEITKTVVHLSMDNFECRALDEVLVAALDAKDDMALMGLRPEQIAAVQDLYNAMHEKEG